MTGRYSLTRAAVCNAFAGSESESFFNFFCDKALNWDVNTATPRVCHNYRVPGEIKRREMSPSLIGHPASVDVKQHKSQKPDPKPRRDHEQGGETGLRKLDFFRFGLFLSSSATDIVFVTLPK